ncbi:MAG: hypothetical protein AAB909_02575 [Patescibacteria group bacterium]
MKKGIATLISVFLVAMVGVFVVTAWQSRLLLSVHRSQALVDVLVAGYTAESRINDLLAKFLGGYPSAFVFPFETNEILSDGTELDTIGTQEGNVYTMDVITRRQFASTSLRLVREAQVSSKSLYDQVDMVLNIDCTGSMNTRADASCSGTSCTTRLHEARVAALAFVDEVESFNASGELPLLRLGLSTFGITNKWIMQPTQDLVLLRSKIINQFRDRQQDSEACAAPLNSGGTNVGGSLEFLHNFFATNYPVPDDRLKKIEIVITDGEPNTNNLNSNGVAMNYCGALAGCNFNNPCVASAHTYSACNLGRTDVVVSEINKYGLRDPNVDAYLVTISTQVPRSTKDMLEKYATHFYDAVNATDLADILQTLFGDILSDYSSISFGRLRPTP